jgi:phage terminase large subunit
MKFTNVYKKNIKEGKGKRIVVNQGGTSSSKTYSILQLLYTIAANSKKPLLISVVSESMPHLKRGAMRDFFNILKSNEIYERDKHNKTDNTYQVGISSIEFFSADNDAKLRGARRDILYMNECNNMSYETYNQLEVRTKLKVFLDFNPVANFWVHEKVLLQDNVAFIKSTYKDNDCLDEQIIKSIEAREFTDLNWWRVYGLGEVGALEGTVFSNFDVCDDIPEDVKWTYYGMDFGFTNDPTTLISVSLASGELWLKELVFETGLTNQDIGEKLKRIGLDRYDEIVADSAEPKSIVEIKRMGFNVKPAKKGKDSILNGLDILKRYKINITKDSLNLLDEFRHYQWKQDKDGNYLNQPIDTFNHGIDAIRYVALNKIGGSKQKVRAFG